MKTIKSKRLQSLLVVLLCALAPALSARTICVFSLIGLGRAAVAAGVHR